MEYLDQPFLQIIGSIVGTVRVIDQTTTNVERGRFKRFEYRNGFIEISSQNFAYTKECGELNTRVSKLFASTMVRPVRRKRPLLLKLQGILKIKLLLVNVIMILPKQTPYACSNIEKNINHG